MFILRFFLNTYFHYSYFINEFVKLVFIEWNEKFKIFIPKGNRFGDTPDPLDETVGYWNNQDSVLTFKLSLIDRPHYDFFIILESNRSSQGSPFGSFVVVKSNIQGGGVGIWGGYASYTHHFYRF